MIIGESPRRIVRHALIVAIVSLTCALIVGEVGARLAWQQVEQRARTDVALRAAMLRSELDRHRSLPFVLGDDAEVRAALRLGERTPQTAAAFDALSARFERLAAHAGATTVYLIDASGRTIAASNWRTPASFVGENYSFRPYFRNAMAEGAAEFFTLGTVSHVPGLYLARRIDERGGGAQLGVIVVKVQFDALEAQWHGVDDEAFVTDAHGVVLITSEPAWRFTATRPLSAPEQSLLMSAEHLGLDTQLGAFPIVDEATHVSAQTATGKPGWTVHILRNASKELTTARVSGLAIGGLGGVLLSLGVMAAIVVRARQRTMTARREAARAELERQVDARTRELSETNLRLLREVDERARAEASLHRLQDELVQTNKLAVLGQISAGVAHEINQPLSAIRSYVDNTRAFLARSDVRKAGSNLDSIAALTDRIGAITQELRTFSRKSSATPQPVPLEAAIAGALLLMSSRLRARSIKHVRNGQSSAVRVIAERARLEQVLVNLLQNAADALDGVREPRITIDVHSDADEVQVEISDNGPGISAATLEELFTPFVTSKPNGLGLGLVISRDIAVEFGGRLEYLRRPGPGATFVLALRRAP
ncbi:sensor histidine kinase [Steroidobacter cummioxidans]|uniref:sensor histidine kinase n=1 Tax=Steroidobacter cummioxidans TaxID=1803913 RepID=UPI0019D47630|nr:ATP-binding protein [Steroidobacter cummioxidans]